MEIIITNGGNSESWYRKKVGQKFTVVDCKLGWGENDRTYNVFNPDDEVNEQSVVWKKDCALVLARSAPETTASPSETAADKGILTEEELKEIEIQLNSQHGYHLSKTVRNIEKLIVSNRSTLSANAELSFKNQKLNKAYDKCATGGNSLASVIIGWNLPKSWHDWSYVEANDFLHNLYGINSNMAYERYEIWLCWKSIKEAGQTLEELK